MKHFSNLRPLIMWVCLPCVALAVPPIRNVTFLSTSDCHYREPDHRGGCNNDLDRASIDEMNLITTIAWPDKLGADKIGKPRGVVALGDLIDDGDRAEAGRKISAEQYKLFAADFGLDGTDGVLKYPVFEGWGNHDGPPIGKEKNGFSSQGEIKRRNALRLEKKLISNVSENGLHYSWNWDDVHLVQLNIYPADKQNDNVHYSKEWHNPQGALAFLKADLAKNVGTSGRPVILMAHCGFDTNWWIADDWAELYAAAKAYNVVLYLFGHSGTGVGAWAPAGEDKQWTWINDGQTTTGFFVINLTGDRLRAAYRMKTGVVYTKGSDGKQQHTWDGKWEWKWLVDKQLASATTPSSGVTAPATSKPKTNIK